MKQYTTPEQTAKLIELGFEKPKSISGYYQRPPYEYDAETNTKMVVYDDTQYPIYAYSIGELIEMLGVHLLSIYYIGIEWFVNAEGIERRSEELIDALYAMILVLKEESDMSDRTLYECSKCGKWESAMFTVYGDKKVNFCPFCGSDQYLCQIKSGKREEENKKK